MITLLVGTSIIACATFGWYGYKANLRIAAWGRNLDEQELILFGEIAPQDILELARYQPAPRRGESSMRTLNNRNYPTHQSL